MRIAISCLLGLWLYLSPTVQASSDYVEVLVGGGEGSLQPPQPAYRDWHFAAAFGQELNSVAQDKLNITLPGEWSFRWMPYASYVATPDDNFELGILASLKIGVPLDDHWLPYLAAGTGPMYTSQDTLEQSTNFNFASYGALGLQYRFDEKRAIGLEAWRRHFSNASLKDPNDGVDTRDWFLTYTVLSD